MFKECLCNNTNTNAQLALAFLLGLVFGPVSLGLYILIIGIILYEIFIIWLTRNDNIYERSFRIKLNISTIIGWLIGRYLYLGKIL